MPKKRIFRESSAAAWFRWRLGAVVSVQLDRLREVGVVQLHFSLLFKSVTCNCLKGLLHVDRFFSAGFKIRDVVLALTPGLCSFSRHLSVLQVDLVAQNHKREVFGVSGTGLDQELVAPGVECFESVGCSHVKHQDAAVGAAIESYTERLEPLLPSCVPNLTQTKGNYVKMQRSKVNVKVSHFYADERNIKRQWQVLFKYLWTQELYNWLPFAL